MKGRRRSEPAADVEDDLADAGTYGILGAHCVRPKPIDLSLLEGFRGGDARMKRPAPSFRAHGRSLLVAIEIDACLGEQLL